MSKFQLGDIAKDSMTGLAGIVVCHSRYLYGCDRYSIQPQEVKDGKPTEWVGYDEAQLELVSSGRGEAWMPPVMVAPPFRTGGPRPDPSRGR